MILNTAFSTLFFMKQGGEGVPFVLLWEGGQPQEEFKGTKWEGASWCIHSGEMEQSG